jgi:50S ribosomal protein L16 3-hydroxylase
MDDVMISFAATGGSVGAHVDQYDVFLLQAYGHRRWQIDASESTKGKRPPLDFRDDVELKLLRRFKPTHDWVLEPGDMLYLPPNVPHNGVAEDPCLTFSFGMRAPASAELISDYLDTLIEGADESIRYQDPDLKLPEDPNEIDVLAMNRVVEALNAIRMNDPDKLGDWFGRFITTYRAAGDVVAGADPLPREEIEDALQRHPWARMAWRRAKRGASLYCSGLEFALPVKDAQVLAATEQLGGPLYLKLSAKGRDAVQALVAGGYYQLFDPNAIEEDVDDEEDDVEDGHFAEDAVVDGTDSIEVMHDATVEADVHEVTIHEDGIEVIVDFDDSDDQDDGKPV